MRIRQRMAGVLLCGSALSMAASEAEAQHQSRSQRVRRAVQIGAAIHNAWLGAADGVEASRDLDATWGFDIRVVLPLHDYVAIGGLTRVSWWRTESIDEGRMVERSPWLDFDVQMKLRYPFELRNEQVEAYMVVPGGLTVGWLDQGNAWDGPQMGNPGVGWNVGVMLGIQAVFPDGVGGFLQGGWIRHTVRRDVSAVGASGTKNGELTADQLAITLGFVIPVLP